MQQNVVDDDIAGFIPEARIAILPSDMMSAGQMQRLMRQSSHKFFLRDGSGKGRVIAQRCSVRPEVAAAFVRFQPQAQNKTAKEGLPRYERGSGTTQGSRGLLP